MRVAVVDSGVHAAHPHVQGVTGGIALDPDGPDYSDRLGHGTAVTAVIRALAPDAQVFAVKVFHERLGCKMETLVRAIDWSIDQGMNLVNLSLGSAKSEHTGVIGAAVGRATSRGLRIVAAKGWLPGDLPGVIPVALDWDCAWDAYREEGGVYYACGYPRPIPGVPVEGNLSGISFAVAHVTACLAREGV